MKRNSKSNLQKKERSTKVENLQEATSENGFQVRSKKVDVKPPFYERIFNTISYLKYVVLILLVPPILNKAALNREFEALQPEGERVHMGWGQKMFISCKGEGLPTVILDAPTGSSSDIWLTTQKEIAKFTQVCIYDRSGLGFSDPPFGYFSSFNDVTIDEDINNSRRFVAETSSVKQMVKDLNHLLTIARPLPKPFILVGSEISSLIARYYSQIYPKDVTGVVLIDPMVENMFLDEDSPWSKYWNYDIIPYLQPLHLSALWGISRLALLTGWLKPELDSTDEKVILRQKYMLCNPSHMLTIYNEHFLMNTSFFQMRELLQTDSFPQSVSVTVLNSNYMKMYSQELSEDWGKSQQYLRKHLHPGCRHEDMGKIDRNELFSSPTVIVNHVQRLLNDWKTFQNVFLSYTI